MNGYEAVKAGYRNVSTIRSIMHEKFRSPVHGIKGFDMIRYALHRLVSAPWQAVEYTFMEMSPCGDSAFRPREGWDWDKIESLIADELGFVRLTPRTAGGHEYVCVKHGPVPATEVYSAEGGGHGHAGCWSRVERGTPMTQTVVTSVPSSEEQDAWERRCRLIELD